MSNLLLTSSVRSWIAGVLYSIALWIDGIIFYFVSLAYRVFFVISRANLFSGDELTTMTHRVYIILGVVMLFVFAYNILVMIAQPDNLFGKDDNSMGSLAKNMIISIVLLTLLPTIFSYMQKVQDGVIESNVIGNILLGGWSESTEDFSVREAGTNTALLILGAFYHPIVDGESVNAYDCDVLINEEAIDVRTNICIEYLATYWQAQELEKIDILTSNDILIEGVHAGSMHYMPIISWVAGAFAAYLFVSFSMDIGIRVAKLGFLQVIAPIPVVLRITKPKGGTFERWKKELTTTYFSLFIRLMFIFFAMYVISLVPNVIRNLFPTIWGQDLSGSGTFDLLSNTFAIGSLGSVVTSFENGIVRLVAQAILILGILKFAKDGPKMVEDLFQIEHLQISIKKKLGENEYGMRAISAVGAGAGTMAGNVYKGIKEKDAGLAIGGGITGLVGGTRRGWKHGGVDDISKLGGAINTARQETDSARGGREEFYNDPRGVVKDKIQRKFGTKLPGQSGFFDGFEDGSIGTWLSGETGQFWQKHYEAYNAVNTNLNTIAEQMDGFIGEDIFGNKINVKAAKAARNNHRSAENEYISGARDEEVRTNLGYDEATWLARSATQKQADRTAEYKRIETFLSDRYKNHRKQAYAEIANSACKAENKPFHDNFVQNMDKMLENFKNNKNIDKIQLQAFIDKWNQEAAGGVPTHPNFVNAGDFDSLVAHMKNNAQAEYTAVVIADMDQPLKALMQNASVNKREAEKK